LNPSLLERLFTKSGPLLLHANIEMTFFRLSYQVLALPHHLSKKENTILKDLMLNLKRIR